MELRLNNDDHRIIVNLLKEAILPELLEAMGKIHGPQETQRRKLSRKEIRQALGRDGKSIAESTLHRLIKEGLPVHQVGRIQLFDEPEVFDWMKEQNE